MSTARRSKAATRALAFALAGFCVLFTAGIAGAAPTPKGWQTLLTTKEQGVFPLGWASGRVWFVTESFQADYTLWSARVAAGKLAAPVSTPMGSNEWLPSSYIVGSNLVNCCISRPDQGKASSIAPLYASGKAGAWAAIPGEPEKVTDGALLAPANATAPSLDWLTNAAAPVGGRTIWAMGGKWCPTSGPHQCTTNGGGYATFALCCTTAGGSPSDLTSMVTSPEKANATDVSMGLDTHGRLWLAWLDAPSTRPGIAFKLVQLDPATLKPLSSQILDHTLLADTVGSNGRTDFVLTCFDTCRLVYQGLFGVFSWGGDGPPTRIWASNPRKGDSQAHLLAVGVLAGGLRIASIANKVPNIPDDGQRVSLFRADSRGRNLRRDSSVDIPTSLPDGATHAYSAVGLPVAIPTPSGLVLLALYNDARVSGVTSRLFDAVLAG